MEDEERGEPKDTKDCSGCLAGETGRMRRLGKVKGKTQNVSHLRNAQ